MRRASILRSFSLLPIVASAGCFAASSGGAGPDANFTVDGEAFDSSMNEPDASVDSSTADVTTEAAPVESGLPEAAPAEAEAGPPIVAVRVTNASGPESGITVVFQDASGNVVMATTTGATGIASFLAAAGSQVTVVMGTAAAPYLLTIQGIAPGDVLAVYDPTIDLSYDGEQVNVASVPGPPEAVDFTVSLGNNCTNTLATFPILTSVGPGCVAQGDVSVMVTANNLMTGGSAYAWQKGLSMSGAGDAGVDADIPDAWSSATSSLAFTGTLPDGSLGQSGTAQLEMIANAVPFAASGGTPNLYIGNPTNGLNAAFTYPTGFADAVQLETGLYSTNTYPIIPIAVVATRTAPADDASVGFDYGTLPPMLSTATIDDTTNPAQPIVTWTPNDAGALANTDGVVVSLLWPVQNMPSGVWTIVAPPTSQQVQVPLLPAGTTAFATDGGVPFANPPTVAFVQASFLSGYPALRAQAGTAAVTSVMIAYDQDNNGGYLGGVVAPPLPVNGTLQMTAITRSGD
jgi:hypothetical protein